MNEANESVSCTGKEIKLSEKDIARFWAKVTKGGTDACWLWSGIKFRGGHGSFKVGGRKVIAHRIAWTLANGPIPHNGSYHGICVCHKCDVPACCNVNHLFLGTHRDNMRDRSTKGLFNQPKGDKHHWRTHPERVPRGEAQGGAKLTAKQVLKIRALYSVGGTTHRQLGAEFNVSLTLISYIINRKLWKHI